MRSHITYILLLLVSLEFLSALSAQNIGSPAHFHWSSHRAHELPYNATLAHSTELSPSEKKSLIHAIEAQVRPFIDEDDLPSLHRIVLGTRIQLKDLNMDGTPEVLAQAFDIREGCGATGNCTFWVFQKQSDGTYSKLLDTRSKDGIGGIELITIETTRTHGLLDFTLAAHDSASEKDLTVYRFNGKQYVQTACYLASWIDDKDPTKGRKTPAISPSRC
jgi:hypothetical protein